MTTYKELRKIDVGDHIEKRMVCPIYLGHGLLIHCYYKTRMRLGNFPSQNISVIA